MRLRRAMVIAGEPLSTTAPTRTVLKCLVAQSPRISVAPWSIGAIAWSAGLTRLGIRSCGLS